MARPHTKNPFYTSPPGTPAAPAGLFSPGLYRVKPPTTVAPEESLAAAGLFSPGRHGAAAPPRVEKPLNSNTGNFGFMNSTAKRVYDARQAAERANLQRAEIKQSLEAAQRKTPANAARIERLSRDLEIARLLVNAAEIKTQLEIVKRETPGNADRIDQLTRSLDAAKGKAMAVEAAGFAVKPTSGCAGAGCSIQGGRRKPTRSKKSRKARSTRKHER
jgi:hypothetical protein